MNPDTVNRPLRADAERNKRRIVDAAAELFAARGIDITLDDVAAHAGVGVGTVYRRFANKLELIDGVFEQRFEDLLERARIILGSDEPWDAMVEFFGCVCEGMSMNRGLGEIVMGSDDGYAKVAAVKAKLDPLVDRIINRAKQSGDLRSDVSANDFFPLIYMIGAATECTAAVDPENWRRYFAIVIDGLRERPDRTTTLPGRPFTQDEIACVKAGMHGRGR
ncbi:TetR family transcriptional regulator [Rhodococcoides trifolii]|uniref:TetR family transcriptional regulator n=1 Tax=Rhodococcoides trifolii TaxID=908250 RepID=A0A917FU85_9NOCA|nr:TetR family transcriptional regulator [Rhodococcus trifolii]